MEILITEELVLKAIKHLKENKSPGPDSIHPMVLQEAATEVVKPLTIIFLQAISQEVLQDYWKKQTFHLYTRKVLR